MTNTRALPVTAVCPRMCVYNHEVFVARESMTVSRHVAHCRAADRRNGFIIDRYGNVTPWRDATRYTRLGCIPHAEHSGGSRHRSSASSRALDHLGSGLDVIQYTSCHDLQSMRSYGNYYDKDLFKKSWPTLFKLMLCHLLIDV